MHKDKRGQRKTFVCDDSMVITIPIGSLTDTGEGQLMPERFQCMYKDSYKIFVMNGKPKPLGAAQVITGVFIVILGVICTQTESYNRFIIGIATTPSVLFIVSGMMSFAAGQSPNMHVTKLSFALNIISFLWSIVAVFMYANSLSFSSSHHMLHEGINVVIIILLVAEKLLALFLIYWLSKAVCRNHFVTLPVILLKTGD
ncbi:membrane-spanning 4-domains subfamily A member 4A [Antennarius striatus]|uniref:membrane-spanning 4-domains subfamily A member 4A n=1 Tax=Antennarius striatus TaxID=241820 RepID=UPI0035B0B848